MGIKMKTKTKTKYLTFNALLAACYIALTLINPLSWNVFQFRISEILSVMPFYNKKYRLGMILGCAVANAFSPLGICDIAVGTVTGVIAYYGINFLKLNVFIKALTYSLLCGFCVAVELLWICKTPYFIGFISVFVSTLIISEIGVFVFRIKPLQSILAK